MRPPPYANLLIWQHKRCCIDRLSPPSNSDILESAVIYSACPWRDDQINQTSVVHGTIPAFDSKRTLKRRPEDSKRKAWESARTVLPANRSMSKRKSRNVQRQTLLRDSGPPARFSAEEVAAENDEALQSSKFAERSPKPQKKVKKQWLIQRVLNQWKNKKQHKV